MKHKIKNLLRRKKGIAIEMAIGIMLVVVSLSGLLVSVSVLNRTSSNSLSTSINERLYLDQIGESFVNAVKNGTHNNWDDGNDKYNATVTGTQLTLVDGQGDVKLYVELVELDDSNGYKITQWKYN